MGEEHSTWEQELYKKQLEKELMKDCLWRWRGTFDLDSFTEHERDLMETVVSEIVEQELREGTQNLFAGKKFEAREMEFTPSYEALNRFIFRYLGLHFSLFFTEELGARVADHYYLDKLGIRRSRPKLGNSLRPRPIQGADLEAKIDKMRALILEKRREVKKSD